LQKAHEGIKGGNKMSEFLKSCPFCGGEPRSYGRDELLSIGNVICMNCGVNMEGDDKADAIAAWNRRVADQEADVPEKG
jgi:Lar family restriction alleviation protein